MFVFSYIFDGSSCWLFFFYVVDLLMYVVFEMGVYTV